MQRSLSPTASISLATSDQSVGITFTTLPQQFISSNLMSGENIQITSSPSQQGASNTTADASLMKVTTVSPMNITSLFSRPNQLITQMSSSVTVQPSSSILTPNLSTSFPILPLATEITSRVAVQPSSSILTPNLSTSFPILPLTTNISSSVAVQTSPSILTPNLSTSFPILPQTTEISSSVAVRPSSSILTPKFPTSRPIKQPSASSSITLAITTQKPFTTAVSSALATNAMTTPSSGSSDTKPIPIIVVGLAGVISVAVVILCVAAFIAVYMHRKQQKAKKRYRPHLESAASASTDEEPSEDGESVPSISNSTTKDQTDVENSKRQDSPQLKEKESIIDLSESATYEDVADVPHNASNGEDTGPTRPTDAKPLKENVTPRPKTRKMKKNSTSQDDIQSGQNRTPRPKPRKFKAKVSIEDNDTSQDISQSNQRKPDRPPRGRSSWKNKISFSKADWRPRPKTRKVKDINKLKEDDAMEMKNINKE